MAVDSEFQQRVQRITGLVQQVESLADPSARAVVHDLLQSLMEIHGAGLDRMLEIIVARGSEGERSIEQLSNDPLVSSLLILHGLHPQDFTTRVQAAFERAISSVRSQGGELELLEVRDGAVRVRLSANGHGCGVAALHTSVEDAFYAAAPDLVSLSIESAAGAAASAIVPLEKLLVASGAATESRARARDLPLRTT
jgi:Fe-S cluster biogenesis protein NfuA